MGIGRILFSPQYFFHTPNLLQLPLNHPPPPPRAQMHCPIWTCPSIHVSLCLEEFSPQTSPSGTNYPMVGVLSMCPPHHFSQIPTSGHPCGPTQTRFFAYLALHGLRTTLHTLLRKP